MRGRGVSSARVVALPFAQAGGEQIPPSAGSPQRWAARKASSSPGSLAIRSTRRNAVDSDATGPNNGS